MYSSGILSCCCLSRQTNFFCSWGVICCFCHWVFENRWRNSLFLSPRFRGPSRSALPRLPWVRVLSWYIGRFWPSHISSSSLLVPPVLLGLGRCPTLSPLLPLVCFHGTSVVLMFPADWVLLLVFVDGLLPRMGLPSIALCVWLGVESSDCCRFSPVFECLMAWCNCLSIIRLSFLRNFGYWYLFQRPPDCR